MNSLISRRVIDEAKYMLETKKNIREIAKVFKVSKSTINTREILKYHTDIRYIRGGESTKKKYKKEIE